MTRAKESLKVRLLRQYEERLDKLLETIEPEEELDLREIEEAALGLRQQIGADITQALVETQTRMTPPDVTCSRCGGPMRYKGKKRRHLRTRSGEMPIERT